MLIRAAWILSLLVLLAHAPSAWAEEFNLAEEPAGDYVPTYFQNDVQWAFSADALWLQRAMAAALAESHDVGGNILSQAFAGNNFEPGVRFRLERTTADGNSCELLYFGLQQWADDEFVLGDPIGGTATVSSPTLRFDDTIGGFNTGVIFSYRSRVHNAEFNHWWLYSESDNWTVRWLAGVRYFEFQEQLLMAGVDINQGLELFDGAAYNALLGAQLGGKIERTWNRLSIFGVGKVGLYGNNWNSRVSDLVLSASPFPRPFINQLDGGIAVAGLIDGGGGVRYRLTDAFTLRADYTVLYVPGLTLQPSPAGLGGRPTDGLVLHGFSAGLEYAW